MGKFKVGDTVYARLGTLPAVRTVICQDAKTEKYLIRFGEVQQDWYPEEEISPYHPD